MIVGKESHYKLFWIGSKNGNGGVSILLAQEWMEKVYDICSIPDRLMMIKLAIENNIIAVLPCYAPQVGLDNTIKDAFYDLLNSTVNKMSAAETLMISGDFNGHVGPMVDGYEGVHGGHGYGLRNTEREPILEFVVVHDLVLENTYFHKKDNHLIIYYLRGNSSQIDHTPVRKSNFKQICNMKNFPGEQVGTQHWLLISDMKWKLVKQANKKFTPKLPTWKLKDNVINLFKDKLTHLLASDTNQKSVEDQWMHLKTNLFKTTKETCGISKQGKWHKQTWWQDNSVNHAVNEKRRLFKIWKKGGSKEYTLAKKVAKQAVLAAQKKTEIEKLKNGEDDNVPVFFAQLNR